MIAESSDNAALVWRIYPKSEAGEGQNPKLRDGIGRIAVCGVLKAVRIAVELQGIVEPCVLGSACGLDVHDAVATTLKRNQAVEIAGELNTVTRLGLDPQFRLNQLPFGQQIYPVPRQIAVYGVFCPSPRKGIFQKSIGFNNGSEALL